MFISSYLLQYVIFYFYNTKNARFVVSMLEMNRLVEPVRQLEKDINGIWPKCTLYNDDTLCLAYDVKMTEILGGGKLHDRHLHARTNNPNPRHRHTFARHNATHRVVLANHHHFEWRDD